MVWFSYYNNWTQEDYLYHPCVEYACKSIKLCQLMDGYLWFFLFYFLFFHFYPKIEYINFYQIGNKIIIAAMI